MKLEKTGLLFVISGPAGSGKSTLCQGLYSRFAPKLTRIVTATTRAPRGKELDKIDFYFLTKEVFQSYITNNKFYEHACVYDNYYGILKSEVQDKLNQGNHLLANIDVQGAETLRKAAKTDPYLKGKLITIFILPPSIDELKNRLSNRNEDAEAVISRRLEIAKEEMKLWNQYDYCIHSSSKEDDLANILAIYQAELLRVRD